MFTNPKIHKILLVDINVALALFTSYEILYDTVFL